MSITILNNLNVINTVFLCEGVLVYLSWAVYWEYSGKSIDKTLCPLVELMYTLEREIDSKQDKSIKYRLHWMVGRSVGKRK